MNDHVDYRIRRQILDHIEQDTTLDSLAMALGKTDARILWHLRQMTADGLVETRDEGKQWRRTMTGEALVAGQYPDPGARAFPQRIVDDFEDACRVL